MHSYSPDRFNTGSHNHHQPFLAADRSLDLACPCLAEPNSRLAARVSISAAQCIPVNVKKKLVYVFLFLNKNAF